MAVTNFLFVIGLFCVANSIKGEDGNCIWYGQCGINMRGNMVNCYDNGTARLLTNSTALDALKSECSMFYNGESNTYTCCAPDQILTLLDQLSLAAKLIGQCPSCYYNFRSLFCSMTCHPQQSRFMAVKEFGNSTKYPGKLTVESITYELADDFPQRIIDSCRDVLFGDDHALSTLCGESYDKCTKEDFLDYLGLKNPNLPFPIYFTLTNDTSKNNYYNQTTFQCNQPVITPYKNESICSQIDCPSAPPPGPPPDEPGRYSNVSLRTTQLIIVPDNQSFTEHTYFLPPSKVSDSIILAGPALEISFLRQIFDLQTAILNIQAQTPTNNRSIQLADVCLKPINSSNRNCLIFSVSQYFQNMPENLNKTVADEVFGLIYADYLSHISVCSNKPDFAYDSELNMSCNATFGSLIKPSLIFAGNETSDLATGARALAITIFLENSNDAEMWEKACWLYVQNFTDTQTLLRAQHRWNETANFTIFFANEHFFKRELNYMTW